jgi:hypothetical protein
MRPVVIGSPLGETYIVSRPGRGSCPILRFLRWPPPWNAPLAGCFVGLFLTDRRPRAALRDGICGYVELTMRDTSARPRARTVSLTVLNFSAAIGGVHPAGGSVPLAGPKKCLLARTFWRSERSARTTSVPPSFRERSGPYGLERWNARNALPRPSSFDAYEPLPVGCRERYFKAGRSKVLRVAPKNGANIPRALRPVVPSSLPGPRSCQSL